jgi:hypothetical protein
VVATAGIALSSPLWALVWLEARAHRRGDWLDRRLCVGRSRRSGAGRDPGAAAPPAERPGERRALDMLGAPLRCARFRGDLGPLSRACARRGLDRLPMLLNVVRGEMALVGPSPVPQGLMARWKDLVPDVERRFSVPPGITGLAQLSGDSEEDIAGLVRRAAHDLDYVERRSPWLDLGILLRTVAYVIAPPSAAQHARPRSAAPVRH